MIIGTNVLQDVQEYCIPPHETPIRKLVTLAINIVPPIQSTRRSFCLKDVLFVFKRTTKGIMTKPIPLGERMGQHTTLFTSFHSETDGQLENTQEHMGQDLRKR